MAEQNTELIVYESFGLGSNTDKLFLSEADINKLSDEKRHLLLNLIDSGYFANYGYNVIIHFVRGMEGNGITFLKNKTDDKCWERRTGTFCGPWYYYPDKNK